MARIRLATVPTSDTPPVGQVSIYAKSDLKLYLRDETGAEYEILTGGTPGVGGYEVDYVTLDAAQIAAKEVELSGTPTHPLRTLLDITNGGGAQIYSLDFSVLGNVLSWDGLRLDGILSEGDEIRIIWF
jgi:hypothetical protein